MSMIQVNLMHILVVGPLLTYIGHQKEKTKDMFFHALGGITSLLPFIVRIPSGSDYHSVINSAHYLFYIPFFFYVSYKGNKLNQSLFGLLFGLGIIVIIVHLYLLANKFGLVGEEKEEN